MNQGSKVNSKGPVTVAVVGAGPRAEEYAKLIAKCPEKLKIVAVADPSPERRKLVGDAHAVPVEQRFASYEELAKRPGLAETVINTTSDALHYPSAMPLIAAGYHMLLEKPIARTEKEVRDLIDAAKRYQRVLMVCHGMRYNPVHAAVKRLVAGGAIGRVLTLRASESVAYHHLATTMIRHPRNGPNNTPLLLYKCCHDLDMMAWLVAGTTPKRVSSFASPSQFVPANAPAGSTEYCLGGCQVESTCAYSARKLYTEDPEEIWEDGLFPEAQLAGRKPDAAEKLRLLATSPFGRCVWRCPHNAVDQQGVLIEFTNGVTATFNMICSTPRGRRVLTVTGTDGQIEADSIGPRLVVRRPSAGISASEDVVEVETSIGDITGHWVAEWRMLHDFAGTVRGDGTGQGISRIEDSLGGHQIAFAAEFSRREGRTVEVR